MRKLLLASAAMLSATAGIAMAQNPSQGQLAAPWASGPAANNNVNQTAAATKGVDAIPTPGTVVIRLNGRVEAEITANFTSGDRGINGNGTPNGFKLNPVGISSYMRLYPGFDGLTTNGIRYGASVELRQNVLASTTPAGAVSSPSGNSSAQTVFVRRAFGYVAHDKAGIFRIGKTDGVIGLFDPCTFYSGCWDAGVGNFNGGMMQATTAGAGVGVPFAWLAQAGSEYDNEKIVYLTPQFFGFDFGVQYAPTMGNSFSNSSAGSPIQNTVCNSANANCINVSSGNDSTRWLNQVAVGGRFQQTWGPVDFKAYALYETAGKESLTTTAYTTPTPTGTATTFRYDNLSFVSAAVAVTINNVIPGSLTVAADYIGGALNGQLAMRPTGGAPENALVTGVTWRNGPWTLGAMVGWVESQGDARLTKISQRREFEVAFGGNYLVAPGFAIAAEYMYTQRHQGGFDFVNGNTVANLGAGASTRDAKGNGVLLATVFTW